jgi:hypothetical protein
MKRLFNSLQLCVLFLCVLTFSSCLTSKNLDKFVAKEYNNELPKANKKPKVDLTVNMANPTTGTAISSTTHTTDKFLPLIIYWKYDHRQTCTLNNAIALSNFTNTVNGATSRALEQKLIGQRLELTVEEVPGSFAIVAKENMIWLIYAFSWAKVYIEPDNKDLVVSYKVIGSDYGKAGKITVKNTAKSQGVRWFQSWKSATSEHLSEYNATVTSMTKSFINQLVQEL